MPLPLLAPAAPALLAAAEWTLAACAAGLAAVGVIESTKDKEGEQDKAKADTQAIAYQTKIAGTIYNPELNIIETWLCMNTNFDGWKPEKCLFLEAKANYDQFFKNGEPNGFYRKVKLGKKKLSGYDSMLKQARKQNEVCIALNNIPKSHWHFLQPVSYSYFTEAFAPYLNIKTFNTMMS
ncbi:restriction endonuclease fold toxin 5 domain-containing protein [Photorhabdus sp. RW14-46]|uniref:restriction endonuclease fold toxin 5 domain-containing protein n=1 Tax=Photorhabdus sp. RW14-46 TaxID=2100168 RepID=UPI0013F3E825|nr:restriction endonuclease fold toxin 5 domain-containing protein [Photorhabdus sp. RW14-46]NHB61917.1 hypothetical protein [Photorhabdus sp. RW14-46]